ncbi:MAG: chromate transporter [Polaromonas sp.]|nr:chromate transporter [Polaromonas sp.]
MPAVSFAEAFKFWLQLGFISFGGPEGQMAIMHRELVEKSRRVSEKCFLHALNLCMLLPSPEAPHLPTAAPFPLVVPSALGLGAVLARVAPLALSGTAGHTPKAGGVATRQPPCVIDDDTPTPAHARFKASRLARVLLAGAALWLLPMAAGAEPRPAPTQCCSVKPKEARLRHLPPVHCAHF